MNHDLSQQPHSGSLSSQRPISAAAAGLSLMLAALWGGTPVAVHFAVDQLPPVFTAGIRFSLAALFMLLWCRFEGAGIGLRRDQVLPCAVNGLLLFVQIVLFTVGISMTSASHATVLINTFVFWVAAIDHFVTGLSRLSLVKIAGLAFAASGGVIILSVAEHSGATASQQDAPTFAGDLLLAGSAMLLGVKIVTTKWATRRVEPGKLMLWHDLTGVVLFFLCSACFEWREVAALDSLRGPTLAGLFYQGVVVSGFCFAAQAALLRRHSAAGISIFSVATPLFGVSIAILLRGDQLSPWLAASGVCVALGILLVNLPQLRNRSAAVRPSVSARD